VNASARIAGVGVALPVDSMTQEELWDTFFSDRYNGNRLAQRVWTRCGVERRYGVIDPVAASALGTGERMRLFVEHGVPLGKRALVECLDAAELEPADVGHLVVVSCTGYATPGLDVLLAGELGLSESVERLHVGHMGCYAAVPSIVAAADAVAARGKVALVLCVELTSLHAQPGDEELPQIVAHALFADAAAAVALVPAGAGLEVLDVEVATDPAGAHMMTWDITDQGFRMGLSPEVPNVVAQHVRPAVDRLLGRHGIAVGEVGHWVVHPGGPRILDAVAEGLELDATELDASRAVLHDYGNCSSATVLLVLDRVLRERDVQDGAHAVLMAFGPGLTLYAALLRQRTT